MAQFSATMSSVTTIYLRAIRSWWDGQPNLAAGTETKNKEELKKTKPSSSGEMVRSIVYEGTGSPGGRSENTWVGFVNHVGFKPGVKQRGSYGWVEWWIKRGRSDVWKNRWVWNWGTGTEYFLDFKKYWLKSSALCTGRFWRLWSWWSWTWWTSRSLSFVRTFNSIPLTMRGRSSSLCWKSRKVRSPWLR